MRSYIKDCNSRGRADVLQRSPNREWAGDMPRIRKSDASRRTMREFMDSDGVKRALKARGVSKAAAQKAATEELKAQGLDGRSWQHLSKANQQGFFKSVLAKPKGTQTAAPGKHARNAAMFTRKLEEKGLDKNHIAEIAKIADECADKNAKRAFDAALADLAFDDLKTSCTPHYDPGTRGITLNMEDTAAGFASRKDKAPYQTFFHEYGHYIDHRNGNGSEYASHVAQLGATAKKEVRALLRGIKKQKGYKSIDEAKDHLTREIIDLYTKRPNEIGGLSDIIQGATDATCCGYRVPGHDRSYWKGKWGMHNLSTETFAHFFECTMANPEALETLKKYLPDTYDAFTQMLKGFQRWTGTTDS